jgi:hypothetical protein
MSILRDDRSQLGIVGDSGEIKVTATAGGLDPLSAEQGRVTGVRLDRDDAVALRDWINAALASGAIQ